MTLTVDMTPEQMARLQAEADRSGLTLVDYVRRRLLGDVGPIATDDTTYLPAIDAAMGALAGSGISSEEFMSEKQTETARDEARWQKRFGPRSA